MKPASALIHILALSTCFVVQLGAPEATRMPGTRRAIQTMEDDNATCERRVLTWCGRRVIARPDDGWSTTDGMS